MRKIIVLLLLLFGAGRVSAQPDPAISVHDPVMIQENGTFYIFCTGRGISVFSSKDMKTWSREKPVFSIPPQWAVEAVPGYRGHTWAPDISFHNGWYYLYYSVSAFGKNTSCIGLAVNKTLNPSSPDFKWIDKGKVIQSVPGRDLWNAIDPNLQLDDKGAPWLVFGSFWDGMKLVKLDSTFSKPAVPEKWVTVARRSRTEFMHDTLAGNAAIEAPFLFRKGKYYYLFVSFDYCCRGEKSTYKMMVGRSENIEGPYFDKEKKRMDEGGGSLVLEGNKRWNGVGHNAVCHFGGKEYLVFHAYDGKDNGRSKLKIMPLTWDENGWPVTEQLDQ